MIDAYSDFETRSTVDVSDVGAWKYAAHPSTFPLMFAVLAGGDDVFQWVHREHGENCPDWLRFLVDESKTIFHAWSAGFEIAIYNTICRNRWGWPHIALE